MSDTCIQCRTPSPPSIPSSDPETQAYLALFQDIREAPSESGPQTLLADKSLQQVDQFMEGETGIMMGPDEVGNIFTQHFVPPTAPDWWRETWVITDWSKFILSSPPLELSYVSPRTDADAFIYGLRQENPAAVIYRMDVDFLYEQFDVNAPPVSQLPSQTPPSLIKTVYRVLNKVGSTQAPQGVLYREHKELLNPATGLKEQLRIDHWVLYGGYQMPQDPSLSTVLQKDPALVFSSPLEFATAVATIIAPADGGTPQWFVRTQAIFRQV